MRTVYLPGDEPARQLSIPFAATPAPVVHAGKPRIGGARKGPAWVAAYTGMSSIAERMHPNYGAALRHSNPVDYADAVTSMCDQRAALCLAMGVPVEQVSRNGYNLSRSGHRKAATR